MKFEKFLEILIFLSIVSKQNFVQFKNMYIIEGGKQRTDFSEN